MGAICSTNSGDNVPQKRNETVKGQTPVRNPSLAPKAEALDIRRSTNVEAEPVEVVDPNLTVVGGPWTDVQFVLHSKFGNTKFVGTLVLTYHELKDKYKLKIANGANF